MTIPPQIRSLFTDDEIRRLIGFRQDLHRHPELSFKEERTSARILEELVQLRFADVRRVAGTGVVARIKGTRTSEHRVAIRGDIDALPIQEATGLEYASEYPGIMHACGHDVHAAWTLGAAMLLAKEQAETDAIILFQPAEEIGKGALAMLESGALEGVGAVFGGHVDRRLEVGQVIVHEGPIAASSDGFEIELIGSGAHAARPHEAADPIVAASAVVAALQTIVSRHLPPGRGAVVSIGTLNAGTAANIIPDRARMSGTLRAVDPETRALLRHHLESIVGPTAAAYGVRANLKVIPETPPVVNSPEPVTWASRAVRELLGNDALVPLASLNMAAEDFAFYTERIPGCFLRIGAREEGGEPLPAHSPRFFAAEESIFIGAAVLARTARIASQHL